jgi:hypothetical protein
LVLLLGGVFAVEEECECSGWVGLAHEGFAD